MKILAGSSNKLLATRLAIALNVKYIELRTTNFNDSEIKIEIQESLHNEDIITVQSISKTVNDSLIELSLLVDAAKKAGANRIILVMLYFGYATQDNINSQNIIPAKLIVDFLDKLRVSHIITLDLHYDKIEEFFNIPVSNLESINLYITFLRIYSHLVIVAPDKGSINRVQRISKYRFSLCNQRKK